MNIPNSELLNLSDKVAIVTGGAMGIGQGIALRLHQAGAKLVIADFNQEAGEATVAQLNTARSDSAIFVKTDISQNSDITALVAKTTESFGKIDILVNNAGIYPFQMVLADSHRISPVPRYSGYC